MRTKQKRKNTQEDILFLLISSFAVVSAWIGFNLYQESVTTTISPAIQEQLTPIGPVFDPATIQALTTRENITPLYAIPSSGSQTQTTPTPPAGIAVTTTSAGAPTSTQEATPNNSNNNQGQ